MSDERKKARSEIARALAQLRWSAPDEREAQARRARRGWDDLSEEQKAARIKKMVAGRRLKDNPNPNQASNPYVKR